MPSPVLPGIVRRWALEWAEDRGMEIEKRMVSIDDVLGADEVLLTNSSFGVWPVAAVESRKIELGHLGKEMAEAWKQRVAE